MICKQTILDFDVEIENRILKANNLGAFYRFVNNKLGSRGGIAPLYDSAGTLLVSDSDKADLLNTFFKSVFTQDDGGLPNFPRRISESEPGICDINISPGIIFNIIHKLKTNSSWPWWHPFEFLSKCRKHYYLSSRYYFSNRDWSAGSSHRMEVRHHHPNFQKQGSAIRSFQLPPHCTHIILLQNSWKHNCLWFDLILERT